MMAEYVVRGINGPAGIAERGVTVADTLPMALAKALAAAQEIEIAMAVER